MVVAQVGKCVDVEESGGVNGSIEHKAKVTVPVAVDVLWSSDCSTCIGVVGSLVRHRVACCREVHEGHHGTLMFLEVVVVEELEVLRERRLQTRITTGDT